MEMKSTGMLSDVSIRVGRREGWSWLRSAYFEPPFKVANITESGSRDWLQLMLMSSSPGILDEDRQAIRVEIEAGAKLQLHTQAYQRIYRMKKGAVQTMDVELERGSSFCWLPHPTVPHTDASFIGRNRIRLAEECSMVWGEVVTCGRSRKEEVFSFSRYQMRTELYIRDKLALLDNVCMIPGVIPPEAMGQMEGYTHQASLIYVGGAKPDRELLIAGMQDILVGVSEGPMGILVLRMLGRGAEQLHGYLKKIAETLLYAS